MKIITLISKIIITVKIKTVIVKINSKDNRNRKIMQLQISINPIPLLMIVKFNKIGVQMLVIAVSMEEEELGLN